MKAQLHFWGAAGCVTGSKFLLERGNDRLLVDCGLFQGLKSRRLLNRAPWPIPPSEIGAVILTHGHLDHVGMLPCLVRDGFTGPVYATEPTQSVARIVLEDSAKIQMEEAERAAREGFSRHARPQPLYTDRDVAAALKRFVPAGLNTWESLASGMQFRFRYNGHILGACFAEVDLGGKRLVFSGDIGRPGDSLLFPPERPEQANVLLLESTYGNKNHPEIDMEEALAEEINGAVHERGTCIIPSFAVERLQTVMLLLLGLRRRNRIPRLPIYVDSPMGTNVLELFGRFRKWHRLPEADYQAMQREFEIITDYGDTWKAIDDTRPKVVVAGSGMLSGGRVLTYLSQLAGRPETRILIVGFQAEGTRGRNLLEGAHELKIFGKYVPVRARIRHYEALSAHAGQDELLWWLSALESRPESLFLVHGEPTAQDALRVKLRQEFGWDARIPGLMEQFAV